MRDEEFIIFRNRILIGLIVVIIISIPVFFIIKNKLFVEESDIIKKINDKEDITILVTKDKCDNCKEYENKLKDLNVEYTLLKESNKSYEKILKELNVNYEVVSPTLIYVEDGVLISSLVDIKDNTELTEFIKNYNLSK